MQRKTEVRNFSGQDKRGTMDQNNGNETLTKSGLTDDSHVGQERRDVEPW